MPLAFLLCVAATKEYGDLLASRSSAAGAYPDTVWLLVGSAAVVLANAIPVYSTWARQAMEPLGWPLAAFALAVLAAFLGGMRRYERPGGTVESLGLTVLGIAYCGLLMALVMQMRLLGPGSNGAYGIAAIASLVIVVKMSDVGAYTFGRLFGRHKMTPVISPGKTWEGAAGGVAFACLGSYLALNWLAPAMTGQPPRLAWAWLAYGVIVGVTGIFGDLAESLIKRDVGRKDSSTWMPGFGGVLDVLDSVLYAAPVAFLCWKLGLVGP